MSIKIVISTDFINLKVNLYLFILHIKAVKIISARMEPTVRDKMIDTPLKASYLFFRIFLFKFNEYFHNLLPYDIKLLLAYCG